MKRISFIVTLLGLASLFPAQKATAQTSIPVIHPEPITIYLVDGQDGHPMAHLHAVLAAGYDRTDVERHLWHEAVMTDEQGAIRIPATLLNLPWLRVLLPKSSACKQDPSTQIFSVERMRNDGLSAPNRCGTMTVIDRPGVFTVFTMEHRRANNTGNSGRDTAVALSAKDSEIVAR
jgi:hypothetical protein